jgi:hypothetical protein
MMRSLLWVSIALSAAFAAPAAYATSAGEPTGAITAEDPAPNEPWARAECRWIGTKTVRVLLRDDLIAGEGFHRFYRRFGCPTDRLGEALGCAVPAARVEDVQELQRHIDACWTDPSTVLEVKAPPPPARSGEPNEAPRDPRSGTSPF